MIGFAVFYPGKSNVYVLNNLIIVTKTKSVKINTKVMFIKISTMWIRLTSLLGWAPGITVSVLAGESGEGFGVP